MDEQKQAPRDVILSVKDLVVKFSLRGKELTALRGISLDLYKGESLAIVGESGSGKSVFTKSFIGMLDKNGWIDSGEIWYRGEDMAKYKKNEDWIKIRGKEIAIVFQDPMTSLNPLQTIGTQIREALELHQGLKGAAAQERVVEILSDVGITEPEKRMKDYPHEFSGGMRQRVVIAIAMACDPKILVCDEPTTALDVTIQAQILELLKKLQRKYHLTIVYITHDLGVVANVADRVAVMYAGDIVEIGSCEEVFEKPQHPYTWALLSSLPQLGVKGQPLYSIEGTPPNLFTEIKGDAFAQRNRYAMKIDFLERPPYFSVSPTHKARTWLLDPRAPKVTPPNTSIAKAMEDNARRVQENRKPFTEKLVEVRNLSIHFGSARHPFQAVKNVSFDIYKGETFGLVGESGSGKTTIGRAIIRINPTASGEIRYAGERIDGKISKKLDREITQKIQMIFQDPMASLNERAKVDYIVSEGLMNIHPEMSAEERASRVNKALLDVGLLPEFSSRFPHEFSGGQRQRIGIARALIMEPEFIIADEPISALDVSIRAQVLNLLSSMQKQRGLTYLFISHDLSVMRFICDRIAVIHKGVIVELADTEELFAHPLHPYTRALLSAIPQPDPKMEKTKTLEIYDPSIHHYETDKPSWVEIRQQHYIFCNQQELEYYRKKLQTQ
ncbi:MAG: ABC transporter ATP-binding protein [Clostridia bacterium]|nr:ABC transporter ATP-binding protein [Clostridia bacterium]